MNIYKILIPKDILILLVLATVLNVGRVVIFHKFSFLYLFWNMFLACVPFATSSLLLWYVQQRKVYPLFMALGLIAWLLFFPNAPYIVTDLVHTGRAQIVPVFYDLVTLFSSASVGLLFGMYSLFHIEHLLRMKFSKRTASLLVAGILFLSSFGIYLGRFLRLNSWHIFTDHSSVLFPVRDIIMQPSTYYDAYLFTGFFFFFILMFYTAWKHMKPPSIEY